MSATIVVNFGAGADASALVKVELDGEENRNQDGSERTSFEPGDQPVFLVHYDTNLVVGAVDCSSGMVQDLGQVHRSRRQRIEWTELAPEDLEYIPAAPPTATWYGNDAGVSVVGRTMTPTGPIPAICDLAMQVTFRQIRLVPPNLILADGDEWPILIVVTMEAA